MVVCGGTNSKMEKKPAAEGVPARILVRTPASFELPIWLSPLSPLVISIGVMRSCGIEGAVALQVATRTVIAHNQLFFIKDLRIWALAAHRNSTSASMVSCG